MQKLTIKEAVKILNEHNKWRWWDGVGGSPAMQDVYKIGHTIDVVVAHFDKVETRRRERVLDTSQS
jgi:hypothetical protein